MRSYLELLVFLVLLPGVFLKLTYFLAFRLEVALEFCPDAIAIV